MTDSGKKSDREMQEPNLFFSLGMERKDKKDSRYEYARFQITSGKVTEFNQIFKYVPKTVVAGDLGTARSLFNKKINHADKFTIGDIIAIGRFMEIDPDKVMPLLQLVLNQYLAQKKKKKK